MAKAERQSRLTLPPTPASADYCVGGPGGPDNSIPTNCTIAMRGTESTKLYSGSRRRLKSGPATQPTRPTPQPAGPPARRPCS